MNTRLKSFLSRACLVLLTTASLSGCVTALIGGAGGLLVATDRRTSGAQLDDEGIELRAMNKIRTLETDADHVSVTSYNRRVLLSGEVHSAAASSAVLEAVRGLPNIAAVDNELAVMPKSTLYQRAQDSVITGKVKSSFIDNSFVQSNSIKVVTERGNVYLMGLLTNDEAEIATRVARSVSGVGQVVRLFQIVNSTANAKAAPSLAPSANANTSAPAPAAVTTPVATPAMPKPVQ